MYARSSVFTTPPFTMLIPTGLTSNIIKLKKFKLLPIKSKHKMKF